MQTEETKGVNEVILQLHMRPTKNLFHLMCNISR